MLNSHSQSSDPLKAPVQRLELANEALSMDRSTWLARAGALSYAAWAALHFQAAWGVFQLGRGLSPSMVQGRVFQDGWLLACGALASLVVAAKLNWRNSQLGFWLNLALVSAIDLGFIFFVLAAGYIPLWPGLLGPALWALGASFSGLALATADRAEGRWP